MWPFKKKPGLIRDKYLEDNAINSKFGDAFQRSNSVLRKDIAELKKQSAMWKTKANKNHEQKELKSMAMDRLDIKIRATDKPSKLKDLVLQLDKEDEHFQQLTKETLDIKDSSKSVCNTIGLLESIHSGTYTDPELLSDPPEQGWAGGWVDLFANTKRGGDVGMEELNEHIVSHGIEPKPIKKIESKPDEGEDSADPVLDGV